MLRRALESERAWVLAVVFAVVQGLLWWALTPPWSAPDEPGHYVYARLLADGTRGRLDASMMRSVEATLIASMAQYDWWTYLSREEPEPLPTRFVEDPLLAASGAQVAEPRGFYLVPAMWLRMAGEEDPATNLRWLRLWALVVRLGAVAAALVLARYAWPERRERWLGLGLLAGGLPMVGFIGGSFNNAALAMTWGALLFLVLALPTLRWRWGVLAAGVVAGVVLVHRSLVFLAAVGVVWSLASEPRLRAWRGRVLALLLVGMVVALLPNPRWAAGWRRFPEWMQTRRGDALYIDAQRTRSPQMTQFLSDRTVLGLRGQELRLEVEAWGSPGTALRFELADGMRAAAGSCPLRASSLTCRLQFTPNTQSTHLKVSAWMTSGQGYFRMRLADEHGRDLLFNGRGRYPDVLSSPLLRRLEKQLPVPAGYFAQALSPEAWDALSQLRYLMFAGFTWLSFWGYFGWLSRPLPWWCYGLLLAVNALAIWGLGRWAMEAVRRWRQGQTTNDDRLLGLSLLTLALLLVQVWMPMVGQAWQPQGRYLFPGLVPISALLLLGWERALGPGRRGRVVYLLIGGLTFLNALALSVVS